jgi:hypothetical protein
MFDTAAFAEKAATIAKEKADALAKQELEELQAAGGCWMGIWMLWLGCMISILS